MKKLVLIDTFNFLHRAYHALPKTLSDEEGNPTNAVYGVTSMLVTLFDQLKPDYVVAANDSEKPTFRVEEFTGYKAHRKPMDDELSSQIPKVFEILDAFGIKQITVDGYEADDIIGTLSKDFGKKVEIVIVSNDRDLWQLVDKNVMVMIPAGTGQADWLGEREVKTKLGFEHEKLIDYKALRGDPSDNIPGVHGVGDITARNLISEYGTIENIYKNIAKVKPNKLREKLANNAEEAAMSKKLASIITDVPIDTKLSDCKYTEFNRGRVVEVLKKYNFKSLIKRLGFDPKPVKEQEVPKDQLPLM
jgi:DNA polymerase I